MLDILNESDEPISMNKRKAINLMKKLNGERSLEQQHLRGEYLSGDLEVISFLARQPGGYYLRAVLDILNESDEPFP